MAQYWQQYRQEKKDGARSLIARFDSSRSCYCPTCDAKSNKTYTYTQIHKWLTGLNFHERQGVLPCPTEEELSSRVCHSFWDYFVCDVCNAESGEGPCDLNDWAVETLEKRNWKPMSDIVFQ